MSILFAEMCHYTELLKHNSEQLEVHVLLSFKSKLKIKSAWFDNNVIYAFEINQIIVNKF